MKQAYIRPVYVGERLSSLALCRNEDVITDSDIISHFSPETPGIEIKEVAVEMGEADSLNSVHWSDIIDVE